MTIQRMIELLEIEHECMLRKSHDDCDSICNMCDLLQDDGELHEMYTDVIALVKAQEQFLQWLARLVTHEDGDGAECEIICRRLRKMGYVEKYEENGVEYWRAVKRDE